MKKVSKVILILCVLIMSCDHKAKESKQVRQTGINGEAIYVFNPDGSLKCLFKEEYSIHDFTVFVRSDTLKLGEEFESLILIADPKSRIKITSPDSSMVVQDGRSAKYNFRPETVGVYNYRGTIEFDSAAIEFDSTVAKFEYKFIVVKK